MKAVRAWSVVGVGPRAQSVRFPVVLRSARNPRTIRPAATTRKTNPGMKLPADSNTRAPTTTNPSTDHTSSPPLCVGTG